ncbi:MAG: hypothetical protein M1482_11635, partial [Chloroflexi bacterium]|nr:hypothetical protein [Chloroflexota bacterium]
MLGYIIATISNARNSARARFRVDCRASQGCHPKMFNIIVLGIASFLTDISTEMVYPLLPQ